MDSPLWGAIRLYSRNTALRYDDASCNQHVTTDFWTWVAYYYDPFGHCLVCDHYFIYPGFPTSTIIFLSLAISITLAVILVLWQHSAQMYKLKQIRSYGLKENEAHELGFIDWAKGGSRKLK